MPWWARSWRRVLGLKHFPRQTGHDLQVARQLEAKLARASADMKVLERQLETIDDAMRQISRGTLALNRAHRSTDASLSVCEKRIELRSGRPFGKMPCDRLQQELNAEKKVIFQVREELECLIGRGDQIACEL